ncbi:MAG: hypothetical protein IJG45_04410 [Oscillospiraceae bacterium]|nr:hypothetical protein [Oscillospiraceae bacterium]
MDNQLYISLAGLTAEINYIRRRIPHFFRDYWIEKPENGVDIVATATPEGVEAELEEDPTVGALNAEKSCIFRCIAERSPYFGSFLFHCAAISYEGEGYLFGALSGTGKSTHISLWRQYLGEKVEIVNGDKPLLRMKDGQPEICSTPWAGKEGWQKNCIVPLRGICLLCRGEENKIERVEPKDCMRLIIQQVYLPRDRQALILTLDLLDQILQKTPVYLLHCDISEEAVKTSFEAMTGRPYPKR